MRKTKIAMWIMVASAISGAWLATARGDTGKTSWVLMADENEVKVLRAEIKNLDTRLTKLEQQPYMEISPIRSIDPGFYDPSGGAGGEQIFVISPGRIILDATGVRHSR